MAEYIDHESKEHLRNCPRCGAGEEDFEWDETFQDCRDTLTEKYYCSICGLKIYLDYEFTGMTWTEPEDDDWESEED